jgi:hypothetical protein
MDWQFDSHWLCKNGFWGEWTDMFGVSQSMDVGAWANPSRAFRLSSL